MAPSLITYELGHVLAREVPAGEQDCARMLTAALVGARTLETGTELGFRLIDGLSFYDASYVAVAHTTGTTLVTYDRVLMKSARSHAVDARHVGAGAA